MQVSVNDASSSDCNRVTEVLDLDFSKLQGQIEDSILDKVNNESNLDERLNSSCHEDTLLWLNDYKCSVCGIELPPSFVEERQEHSDFHLAEKLQKEESSIHPRNSVLSRRYFIILSC